MVRLITSAILCALVLVGTSTLARATPSKASSGKISARLTKTSFTSAQAHNVKLIYKFSARSKSFGYLLSFKKSSKWQTVTSVKKTGVFRGPHEIAVKKLFAGRRVKVAAYRLKLLADGGSKLLRFRVKGSKPINTALPTILGATKQGQPLTADTGQWTYSPTSYAYHWRRCNRDGASCSDISGASTSNYTLTAADVTGSSVRVVVTASNSYGSASAISAPMVIGATVLAVSTGKYHTCALSSVGTVKCWGYNGYGELGNGTYSTRTSVLVKGVGGARTLSNVTQISAGDLYTCALLADGTVDCWGAYCDPSECAAGDITFDGTPSSFRWTPVPAPFQIKGVGGNGPLSNVTQISAGYLHTCALLTDHTVECWGSGRLGNGTTTDDMTVQVKGVGGTGVLSNVAQISAGDDYTRALLSDGTVDCWGSNWAGQLGNGTTTDSMIPVQVKGVGGTGVLSNVAQISAGSEPSRACALLSDGTVKCWGDNHFGQLGDGTKTDSSTPVQVKGVGGTGMLSNVTQISTGGDESCALLSDRTVDCWSSSPFQVKGVGGTGTLSNVTQISSKSFHACALRSDGTVDCWGLAPVQARGVGGINTF